LGKGSLSSEVADQLAKVLRTEQHLLASAEQALFVAESEAERNFVDDADLMEGNARYRAEVVSLMELANPETEGFSFTDCEAQLERVQAAYDDAKNLLLHAGAELRTPIHRVISIQDQNSQIRRMARQMVKAMHHLSELYLVAEVREIDASEAALDIEDKMPGGGS
jgi:phosphate:Na+ symporter